MLAIADEDEFVAEVLANLGPQPPNFRAIVELNTGPLVTDGVEMGPLAPRQVDQKLRGGALLFDVRTDDQFDDAHVPGAVANPMIRAGFGSKLAWLADREQEIVFIGRDDADGRRAGELAAAVGICRPAGFLHGGRTSWRQERRQVQRTERVSIADLAARAEAEPELQIVDVREHDEFRAGHIPGAVFAVLRSPRASRTHASRRLASGPRWDTSRPASPSSAPPTRTRRRMGVPPARSPRCRWIRRSSWSACSAGR